MAIESVGDRVSNQSTMISGEVMVVQGRGGFRFLLGSLIGLA